MKKLCVLFTLQYLEVTEFFSRKRRYSLIPHIYIVLMLKNSI